MSSKPTQRQGESDSAHPELLPVMFAANRAEAEFYETLLTDAGIQVVIDTEIEDRNGRVGKGMAVLVPAEQLDEASDIITAREEIDEHMLSSPEAQGVDEDEDELIGPNLNDNTAEDEDLLFHRDPFTNEDDD